MHFISQCQNETCHRFKMWYNMWSYGCSPQSPAMLLIGRVRAIASPAAVLNSTSVPMSHTIYSFSYHSYHNLGAARMGLQCSAFDGQNITTIRKTAKLQCEQIWKVASLQCCKNSWDLRAPFQTVSNFVILRAVRVIYEFFALKLYRIYDWVWI